MNTSFMIKYKDTIFNGEYVFERSENFAGAYSITLKLTRLEIGYASVLEFVGGATITDISNLLVDTLVTNPREAASNEPEHEDDLF